MFDVSWAMNETLGLEEIQIEHDVHIAETITNVESETWVVAVDVVILVSVDFGLKPTHEPRPSD